MSTTSPSPSKPRCAIIGAGACGLPSARWALAYGYQPTIFETTKEIGGLWSYKPHETDLSSVMRSTVINTSKEMTAYSDFPPPPHFANYMHNLQLLEYFKLYAKHHALYEHILFNHHVMQVTRSPSYPQTGQWTVTYRDETGGQHSEVFDCVLVCTGHHAEPRWPEEWENQDKFKGKILHAHSYKDHRGWEDDIVVVVGTGNSGMDVAVEQSRIAKETYLSTRRGTWVLYKVSKYGRPFDFDVNRRLVSYMKAILPLSVFCSQIESLLNQRFDHAQYGLKPQHRVMSQHPTVNEELPNRLISGLLKIKPNIRRFTDDGEGIEWDDDTVTPHVDKVVMATGYKFGFPLLEQGELIPVIDNSVPTMYKYMYPTQLADHNTLAVIGLFQPIGSIMPLAEMQARVFFNVLSKQTVLPSQEEMMEDIRLKREENLRRYVHSPRHTIQVDYVEFMDELGDMIGCVSRPMRTFFEISPVLAWLMVFGHVTSYQYRLRGPHPWEGALQAALTVEERVVAGNMGREVPPKRRRALAPLFGHLGVVAIVVGIIYAWWVRYHQ